MDTEKDWVYRVEEPHGSEGWRLYDGPEKWGGVFTTDNPYEDAEYVAGLVIADVVGEWKRNHADVMHVRVLVWEDEEGEGLGDAIYAVEVRPNIHAE
ncbi:hypothetical protein ABZ468_42955 [Streptomyces sp. NPDC005708]|uniref:hypothetical protein n=1 Tax=Streptomyces sp. NPDC005708 TaxID=3154564 RepID=UPI0034058574